MELLFRLAKRPQSGNGAGFVGQITSNSFMKREFGKKLIQQFLSGTFTGITPEYVDLTHIIDTSGAYIPGHGTPTVILAGRPQKPQIDTVRAVLGIRGEPGQPADPAHGLAWLDITQHLNNPGYDGPYVSVSNMPRTTYGSFPWSLSGGGAGELKDRIESAGGTVLGAMTSHLGISAVTGEDSLYLLGLSGAARRLGVSHTRLLVEGDVVRDYQAAAAEETIWPYRDDFTVMSLGELDIGTAKAFWTYRRAIDRRRRFGTPMTERGLTWWEWQELYVDKLKTDLTITFAFVATHNHFVLDRGGKVFNRSAPVIKLPEGATEDDHYDLLGVLNSSTACFWLKQVSHNKGGPGGGSSKDEKWRDFYEFTGTKLAEYPIPSTSMGAYARRLDELAAQQSELPGRAVAATGDVAAVIAELGVKWHSLREQMIAVQEELDWATYRAYGLTALEPLAADYPGHLEVGERAVEIALARRVAAGEIRTRWLDEFASKRLTEPPQRDDLNYAALVGQRLREIEENGLIRLLEVPDYKRKWETVGWGRLIDSAARDAILNRLEAPELWVDANRRPRVRSIAQLSDELRKDETLRELIAVLANSQDFDLSVELSRLVVVEAVPALATLRYKTAGVEKFRAWERTWELQRAEDRGELVDVPVPPKYAPGDFLKTSYWSARGKLDVPKERFIAFPGSHYPEDATAVYGWAGWDHGQRGQAIARFANDLAGAGAPDDQVIPLVGALIELEPWLKQWHDEIGNSGVSPAGAVASMITALVGRLGLGRDTIADWRAAPPPRKGRSTA